MRTAVPSWFCAFVLAATGCPSKVTPPSGSPSEADRFPRLTHQQWENTVQSLFALGAPPDLATKFQPDPQLGRFDNNIARLAMSSSLWRSYQDAAETIAARVAADPGALSVIVPASGNAGELIATFGLRAFRRPLGAGEVARYQAVFDSGALEYPEHDPFTAGVRRVIEAMLQSPFFLYRAELADAVADGGMPLDPFEVASRLSYVMWNTMPDDVLLAAAAAGELDDVDGVIAQAKRMFGDARAERQLRRFHFQAFALADYADLDKDPVAFPGWRHELGGMMQEEAERFLSYIVSSGGGVADVLTSTTAFVNADLAAIYRVQGSFDTEFRRVELDPVRRAGLLTRSGFLARNATLADSDPIHRGVFVNLNLVCRTISARPNLPDFLMPVGNTTRERVNSISGPDTCGEGCHARMINPIGFSLEHYDAVGAYRDTERGFPINSADLYGFADGRTISFSDGVELSQQLAKAPEVHACYVGQVLEFVLGRSLRDADQATVKDLAARSLREKLSIEDIVLAVVANRAFRSRAPGAAP